MFASYANYFYLFNEYRILILGTKDSMIPAPAFGIVIPYPFSNGIIISPIVWEKKYKDSNLQVKGLPIKTGTTWSKPNQLWFEWLGLVPIDAMLHDQGKQQIVQ